MKRKALENVSSRRWQSDSQAKKYVEDTDLLQRYYQSYYNNVAHGIFRDYCMPGNMVLDVGCGTGILGINLAEQGCHVTGCDISMPMLKIFRGKKKDLPIKLMVCDAHNLPFTDNMFDVVTSHRVVQHFPGWKKNLKEMARCCMPGGLMVFNLFSRDHRQWAAENCKKEFESVFYDTTSPGHGERDKQYAVEIGEKEILKVADDLNLQVHALHPYCILDKNQMIGRSLGTEDARLFDRQFHTHLENEEVMDFLIWLEKTAVRFLPNIMSDKIMVVMRKPG